MTPRPMIEAERLAEVVRRHPRRPRREPRRCPPGTILGVLGPNGAGKTTTVRMLTTLSRPDGGRAEVAGHRRAASTPQAVRRRIGVTGQNATLDEPLTGRENLEMIGQLAGVQPAATPVRRATEMLERFDLTDAADRVVKGYSGGMRRRLDLSASLVGRPTVLFLDEPTTGLDPTSRMGMWDIIRELVADGTTVLLTTQYLDEADTLADRIVGHRPRHRHRRGHLPGAEGRRSAASRLELIARRAPTPRPPPCSRPLASGPVTVDGRHVRMPVDPPPASPPPSSGPSTPPASPSTTSRSVAPRSTTCSSPSPAARPSPPPTTAPPTADAEHPTLEGAAR